MIATALRLVLLLAAAPALAAGPGLPVVDLVFAGTPLRAEVAATPEARQRGLMHRTRLAADQGMLFVFPGDEVRCMWMKDTPLPLAVAFLDANGGLLNLVEMRPHSLDLHCSSGPARYALEMNTGWFAGKAIWPGRRLTGLERLPAPR